MIVRALLLATLLAPLAGGCGSTGPSSAAPAIELQVYAAASLKRALAAVAPAYAARRPEVTLTVSTDSSAALATKIEQGAPADLFLAADLANPTALAEAGLAAGPVTPFAANRLTVIVPAANPARITTPADLAGSGVRIVAAAEGVPIERYTRSWLELVAALPAYGPEFPARYAANVVSREENAGAIVAKVALGEGDAAVVYVTDARDAADLVAVPIPDAENVPATYAGVVVASSGQADEASRFLAWLAGPEGRAILAGLGFLPPGG